MIRKTLTILSLIGLLLSVGLWGGSCFGLHYQRVSASSGATSLCNTQFYFLDGLIVIDQQRIEQTLPEADATPGPTTVSEWHAGTRFLPRFVGRQHHWIPTWHTSGEIRESSQGHEGQEWHVLTMPIYLLLIVTGVYPVYLLLPLHRRRKRKKLGQCVKCGYDLRGSRKRCPECGTEFDAAKNA